MPLPALLLPALAWSAPAVWLWPEDSSRSFGIEVYLRLPEPLPLESAVGTAEIERIQLQLLTSCDVGRADPGGWTLVCVLRDLSLVARQKPGQEGDIGPVLEAVDKRLSGALLTLAISREGRVAGMALADLTRADKKAPRAVSSMVCLLERALLGLDLTLPDEGQDRWAETGSALLSYVPASASHGVSRAYHRATPANGALDIASTGRAVIQAPALSSGSGPTGARSINLVMQGSARFELDVGLLSARSWTVLGRATPLVSSAPLLADPSYAWSGTLRWIQPGDSYVVVPTGVWTEGFAPGAAWQVMEAARPALEAVLDGVAPFSPP